MSDLLVTRVQMLLRYVTRCSILRRGITLLRSPNVELWISDVDICTHPRAISNCQLNQAVSLVKTYAQIQPGDTYKYPNRTRVPEMLLVAATLMVSMEGINNADTGASNRSECADVRPSCSSFSRCIILSAIRPAIGAPTVPCQQDETSGKMVRTHQNFRYRLGGKGHRSEFHLQFHI